MKKRRGWKKSGAWSLSEEAFLKIKNEHLLFILQENASARIGLSPSCLSKRWQFSQKKTAKKGGKILYPWPAKAKKEIEKLNNSLCLAIWHRIYRTRERVPTENDLIALKKKLVDELETLALKSLSTLVEEGSRVLEDSAARPQDPVNSISIATHSLLASERKEPKEIFTEEGIQRIASLWKLGKPQKEVARELGMAPSSLSKRWKKCLESSRYHHVEFQWKPGVQGSLKNLPISACSAIWHTVYGTEAQMTKEDASRLKEELMDELQTIFVEILRAGSKPL